MLKKRIPAYFTVLTFLLGAAMGLVAMGAGKRAHPESRQVTAAVAAPKSPEAANTYTFKRRDGFRFTRPLLYGEPVRPDAGMAALQDSLRSIIERHRKDGRLHSAAVYVREFTQGHWTGVNLEETYDPGSLLKVPVLMAYLEREHREPGTLDRRYVLPALNDNGHAPRFEGPHIEPGLPYTVRQLLDFMILYSDNRATQVLNANLDVPRFQGLFTELGLPFPDITAPRYPMNGRDMSVFLKTLFNSTYLDPSISDQALDLLSRSTFMEGLRKGVPDGVPLAHKFGESGVPGSLQLHESGIVYLAGSPYLITVMTRGTDDERLATVIGDLSAATYAWFTAAARTRS